MRIFDRIYRVWNTAGLRRGIYWGNNDGGGTCEGGFGGAGIRWSGRGRSSSTRRSRSTRIRRPHPCGKEIYRTSKLFLSVGSEVVLNGSIIADLVAGPPSLNQHQRKPIGISQSITLIHRQAWCSSSNPAPTNIYSSVQPTPPFPCPPILQKHTYHTTPPLQNHPHQTQNPSNQPSKSNPYTPRRPKERGNRRRRPSTRRRSGACRHSRVVRDRGREGNRCGDNSVGDGTGGPGRLRGGGGVGGEVRGEGDVVPFGADLGREAVWAAAFVDKAVVAGSAGICSSQSHSSSFSLFLGWRGKAYRAYLYYNCSR